MFSPQRAVRYIARVLGVLLPVLLVLLALALVTELSGREDRWTEALGTWRLWVAVARDMVPGMVALVAAYALAARFVQRLYGIDSFGEAQALVNRCMFGLWSFRPWVRMTGGVPDGDENEVLLRVGGPGHLVVYNDTAVVLERAGRFTRVENSGFVPEEPLERLYQGVDLRPLRRRRTVEAMSKEGIPIKCEADVSLQIDSEFVLPSAKVPFPASKDRIFQVATATWFQKSDDPPWDSVLDWSSRLLDLETDHRLRTILARYPLDQLVGLGSPDAEDPREAIRQELQRGLEAAATGIGAQIHRVELRDIKVADEVTQQWIEAWKAEWKRWEVRRISLGTARKAEQMERAKTQAQVMMLASISDAFQPLLQEKKAITSRLILARLFMVLSRAPSDPLTRVYLPEEAMKTLKSLRELIGGDSET